MVDAIDRLATSVANFLGVVGSFGKAGAAAVIGQSLEGNTTAENVAGGIIGDTARTLGNPLFGEGILPEFAFDALANAPMVWLTKKTLNGSAEDRARSLRALAHCDTPTSPLNISGPKIAIRDVAKRLGERLGIEPILTGTEGPRAWLVDCSEAVRLFGPAPTPMDKMLDWTADWVRRGGASHNKPTHYESKDGKY